MNAPNSTSFECSSWKKTWRVALILSLALYVIAMIRTAWVTEDAFITFRTAENFIQGYGLRWNVVERTQTFTHPLWLGLLVLGRLVSGELYFTSMVVGALCSLGAMGILVFRLATTVQAAVCACTALLLSKAFVEYSTSGLENPLTYLLIAAFAWVFFGSLHANRKLFWLSFIMALSATNRLDSVVLFAPALWVAACRVSKLQAFKGVALGMLPLLLWLAFSLIYYGTPLPLSAYAKAFHGVSQDLLTPQGVMFFKDSLLRDPVLLPFMLLGGLAALRWRRIQNLPLALGALLYCMYTLKIGGGYMTGRFLAAPFFLTTILLARVPFQNLRVWVAPSLLCLATGLGLACDTAPLLSKPEFGFRTITNNGIIDERGFHYNWSGFLSPTRTIPTYGTGTKRLGVTSGPDDPMVFFWNVVGHDGYMAGPDLHLVDALVCEPLLMRLPLVKPETFSIGHFGREVPDGYLETLGHGQNRLNHTGLARFYDDLRLCIRGPVFSIQRMAAIWRINTGAWSREIEDYVQGDYRNPSPIEMDLGQLSTPCEDGTRWYQGDFSTIGRGGLMISLGKTTHAEQLRIGLDNSDKYSLRFMLKGKEQARIEVSSGGKFLGGIHGHGVQVPEKASHSGFDSLQVIVVKAHPDRIAVVAYLQLQ
ncbi:MAG: hypothetical protein GY930_14430 [bacterium]|nr:hypothetical protein [bacterium]